MGMGMGTVECAVRVRQNVAWAAALASLVAGFVTATPVSAQVKQPRGQAVAIMEADGPAPTQQPPAGKTETATFGNGCFWCTEAVFERLKGVREVVSGYSGGTIENATYKQVCTGTTGHAEAVQITFDPDQISYADLLEVFWKTHDPTTLNQQGPDSGTQYRSAVFYHSDEQRRTAEEYMKQLDESKEFPAPIVTEITSFTNFYKAENYHQDYYEAHGREPYCRQQIAPKIRKFNKEFRDKLKTKADAREDAKGARKPITAEKEDDE